MFKVTMIDYHKECKKRFIKMGFIRSGKTYGRVVNDLFQTFTVDRVFGGRMWRVDFGVFPLCYDGAKLCSYNSDYFVDDIKPTKIPFTKDEYSYLSFVKLIEFFDDILVPLFEKTTDYNLVLVVLEEFEKMEEDIRLEYIKETNGKDGEWSFRERSVWGREKYYFALKTENYPYAIEHLDCRIKIFGRSLLIEKKRFQDKSRSRSDLDRIERSISLTEKLISNYKKDRERIVNEEYEYFRRVIEENEVKSRIELMKFTK